MAGRLPEKRPREPETEPHDHAIGAQISAMLKEFEKMQEAKCSKVCEKMAKEWEHHIQEHARLHNSQVLALREMTRAVHDKTFADALLEKIEEWNESFETNSIKWRRRVKDAL